MIKLSKLITTISITTLISSCSTMKESVSLGILTGAGTGAISGALISRNNPKPEKGAAIGAAVGAAVGGIASYFIHQGLENRDSSVRKDTLFNLDTHGISTPKGTPSNPSKDHPELSQPSVEELYVEPHAEGRKFIGGHSVWIINEDPTWKESGTSKKGGQK